jgi:hypothetical protein
MFLPNCNVSYPRRSYPKWLFVSFEHNCWYLKKKLCFHFLLRLMRQYNELPREVNWQIRKITTTHVSIQSFRPHNLQEADDHSINHIPLDDSTGPEVRPPAKTREQKNDLISKVRSHHDKKGRRGNNRCRCRRRRRRGKVANLLHVTSNYCSLIFAINTCLLRNVQEDKVIVISYISKKAVVLTVMIRMC